MVGMDCQVGQREHVRMTEHGVEGVSLVKVNKCLASSLPILNQIITLWMTVIRCPALPTVKDAVVTYSTMSQYDYGTTATYQCDSGYELTGGDTLRTCTGDGSSPVGQWSGAAPVCTGKDKHT